MNYFCVFVHFASPEAIHRAHNDIKTLNFVLKPRYANYNDARRAMIEYVNRFFDNVYGVGAWKHIPEKLPSTPRNNTGFRDFEAGYFCTEDAASWKLSVWNKIADNGILFNSEKVEKVFDIDILQVYEPPDSDIEVDPPKIKLFSHNSVFFHQ